MSRIDSIRKLLERTPNDTFLLYSLGMEHLAAGQTAEALAQFKRVIELDGDYLAAYQQAARACQGAGDKPGAIDMLRRGMAVAQKKGDRHAYDRMKPVLDALTG